MKQFHLMYNNVIVCSHFGSAGNFVDFGDFFQRRRRKHKPSFAAHKKTKRHEKVANGKLQGGVWWVRGTKEEKVRRKSDERAGKGVFVCFRAPFDESRPCRRRRCRCREGGEDVAEMEEALQGLHY